MWINDVQQAQVEKFEAFKWKRSAQYAVCKGVEGIAVVMNYPGSVAVIYPDGTYDRTTGQGNGKCTWRTGWYDPVQRNQAEADRAAAARKLKAALPSLLNSIVGGDHRV